MASSVSSIQVDELAPQKFTLLVTYEAQTFECGVYISRAEALKAGRLFVDRKQAEQGGRQKRQRKKG